MAGGVGGRVVVGRHIYGNLYGCDREVLKDEAALITIVKEAVRVANAMSSLAASIGLLQV